MKKKIFPKISKKIKSFLTDESGKITKKDALGLAAGALLLDSADNIASAVQHKSGFDADTDKADYNDNTSNGHSNTAGSYMVDPQTTTYSYHNNLSSTYNESIPCSSTQHASGIINGHYNSNLGGSTCSVDVDSTTTDVSGHASVHSSHGSHGSHGSHCSCSGRG